MASGSDIPWNRHRRIVASLTPDAGQEAPIRQKSARSASRDVISRAWDRPRIGLGGFGDRLRFLRGFSGPGFPSLLVRAEVDGVAHAEPTS